MDLVEGDVKGAFVDFGAGVGAAVADYAFFVVRVDGGFAERAGALVDCAACVDDLVGFGEFGSACGGALGGHALSFPADDGDRLVEDFCLLEQPMLLG